MIEQFENANLYWKDAEQTVLVLEVTGLWTWDEAHHWMQAIKQQRSMAGHTVYVVMHFYNDRAAILPRSSSVFANLKYLMLTTGQEMVVMVNTNKLMRGFMNILSRAYELHHVFAQFVFVETFEDALTRVDRAKDYHRSLLDEEATLVLNG